MCIRDSTRSGGSGGGGNSSNNAGTGGSGTANTGGGGGATVGDGGTAGSGGSGIVILRFPNTKTITVGAGLTSSSAAQGSDTVVTFTAGTGTVSFAG